ncbi:hypothetical protein E0Z10_g2900 [Xylaria hypoxylon]|uniref:Uncharacterized protein n=1 Tax=Xylaria hypoxylon TaxID=37992 RepID=A0A4Z0YQ08_9PEZI|nr:hypothetical protein E0Z10_g2900 [Xylaria hypoxylon]
MCHPCNRILHGRRVDIAEYEHRWMHERGACDCEVKFPAMLQPRLIQRSSAVADENATGAASAATTKAGTGAGAGTSAGYCAPFEQDMSPKTNYAGNHPITKSNATGRNGQEATIPLYTEAQVGNNVEVAVRLPSLYGAEWTKDHGKLHNSGQCNCPVSFESYKPTSIDYYQDENDGPMLDYSDSQDQTWKTGYNQSSSKENRHPNPPMTAASSYGSDARTSSIDNNSVDGPHYLFGHEQVSTGHIARWTMEGPRGSLLDEILGPIRPDTSAYGGHPVDIQTMHYSTSGIPISGDPIVCSAPQESELPSIVEYQQPQATTAGFPIGAGPEGESHAGNFETCSLYSSYEDSPVKTRRLSSEF